MFCKTLMRPYFLQLCLLALLPHGAFAEAPPTSSDEFCSGVEAMLAGTRMQPLNTVYADYEAFRQSKTTIRPLGTHQYVARNADGRPVQISCKVKTPDHIRAEYGPDEARDAGRTCRDVNRDTVQRIYAGFDAEEKARIRLPMARLVFDEDDRKLTGSGWVTPFTAVYSDQAGRVHVLAKSLRVDWDNLWFAWAPDRLRGAWYCHLIAPEHVRALALGEAPLPPPSGD